MLDERSKKNIRNIMRLVREKDWDWLTVADGDERIGKTTLLMHVLIEAEPKLNRAIECAEYKKVLARCAWTFDGMLELVRTLPNGTAHLYDEASLLGREAMREHNLRMVRVMSTIGIKNRLYLWTFPDFYMLDPYLRDGRVRTRAFVHTDQGNRGYVIWYIRRRYPFPRPGGESVWWYKGFTGTFGSFANLSPQHAELWDLFRERESKAKDAILTGSMPDTRREVALKLRATTYMTVKEIAEAVGQSESWVGRVVKGIPPHKTEAVIPATPRKRYKDARPGLRR